MPAKKTYYKARRVEEARGTFTLRALRVESVVVAKEVWESMKTAEAQALKKVVNLVSEARGGPQSRSQGVRLVIGMDHQRRIPKFEVEDIDQPEKAVDDLDSALEEARERGLNQATRILARRDMLSGSAFATFIGVSREAVRAKHQRHEILGLKGAKRGLRFPKWQVNANGALLPELPQLFDRLGGDSWTVYRFLTQHHPELEGDTALSALQRGKTKQVFGAAENAAGSFS